MSSMKYPDLILVDGGFGHVNSSKEILSNLKIRIPILGMVKNDKHLTRGLVFNEEELSLANSPDMLRFITEIQNEAHRFAIEYNKMLRKKRYQKSILDEIKNLGPKRKKILLKHFGSVENVINAYEDELQEVDGIGKKIAKEIRKVLS